MKSSLFVALLLLGATQVVQAQDRPPRDPLGANFFPPELLMENQTALNLTEAQRTEIKSEIQKAQAKFTDVQWQLKKETEAMAILLRPDRVDEQQTVAQLDKVMVLEREIKRTQVTLMVRIKNTLTADQQLLLRKIKQERDERDREKPDRQKLDRDNEMH
jgi:Spy/CpxP family protein refolding chaperone